MTRRGWVCVKCGESNAPDMRVCQGDPCTSFRYFRMVRQFFPDSPGSGKKRPSSAESARENA